MDTATTSWWPVSTPTFAQPGRIAVLPNGTLSFMPGSGTQPFGVNGCGRTLDPSANYYNKAAGRARWNNPATSSSAPMPSTAGNPLKALRDALRKALTTSADKAIFYSGS